MSHRLRHANAVDEKQYPGAERSRGLPGAMRQEEKKRKTEFRHRNRQRKSPWGDRRRPREASLASVELSVAIRCPSCRPRRTPENHAPGPRADEKCRLAECVFGPGR